MKKIYTLFTFALCGFAALATSGTGNVTFQLDQNLGSSTPDLLDPETKEVSGEFENGILKISGMPYGFMPVEFTINLETGDAVAADQMADEELNMLYYNLETKEAELIGSISNMGSDKCQLSLQPWGVGGYYSGFGVLFDLILYNTVFTFDFAIPGLGLEVDEPVLDIKSVNYSVDSEYGYLEFTVEVSSENLPEENETEVFYKGPYDNDFKAAEESADNTFTFSIAGVEPNVGYTVQIYAKSGSVVSDVVNYPFKVESTGIESMGTDQNLTKFYDLKGMEIKNPQPGNLYIKSKEGKVQKVLIK